jgi:hypothetical protein
MFTTNLLALFFLCRSLVGERCPSSSSDSHAAKEKVSEVAVICHSKLISRGVVENPDGSKTRL